MDTRREELLATRAASQSEGFRVQMNNYDSYQMPPTVFDRASPPGAPQGSAHSYHQVPVLRVYGSLPTGHNILVHVHGIFPYLYIPYEKEGCFDLQMRLERAVEESLSRKKDDKDPPEDVDELTVFKYIAHVSVVKGVPFYGYHVGHKPFFKIYLLNPSYLNRLSDLLRNGALGKKLDVYEAHIPYGLQLLADFNLFGCAWLKLQELFIRIPVLNDDTLKTDELVDYMMGYHTTETPRMGRGALEIDTCAQFILNRVDLKERQLHHDFVERFNKTDQELIYIQSTKDIWKDGDFQRKLQGEAPYSSAPPLPRNSDVKWVESQENQLLFDYVKNINADTELSFSTFVKQNPAFKNVPTAFESVSELFHEPQFDSEIMTQDRSSADDDKDDGDDLADLLEVHTENMDIDKVAQENFEKDLEDEDEEEDEFDEEPANPQRALGEDVEEEAEATIGDISDLQFTQHFTRRAKKRRISTTSTISQAPLMLLRLPPKLGDNVRFIYKNPPPRDLDFEEFGLPQIQYTDPFYDDIPPKPFIHAGKKFHLRSTVLSELSQIPVPGDPIHIKQHGTVASTNTDKIQRWLYLKLPPTYDDVSTTKNGQRTYSQIGLEHKFKFPTQAAMKKRPDGFNDMSVLVTEIFVPTRGDLKPDPKEDAVVAIFWRTMIGDSSEDGMFTTQSSFPFPDENVQVCGDELEMIQSFADMVSHFDPDIIAGYEVHASSWGYLVERSRVEFEYEFIRDLSRCSSKGMNKMGDHWGYTHTSSIMICGRHVINIWRVLRDLNLSKHSVEHVSYHLLHRRIPSFTHKSLTEMWNSELAEVVKYLKLRVEIDTELITRGEIISKATEMARVIGIDFNDVFHRGSQYKVESLLIRIAKAENFMLSSPSKKQVRNQKPLECIPLVMEPISAYYKSPLVVLDFQSLYPSIVIAYNYCYSTLLGSLKNYSEGINQVGTGRIKHPTGLLKLLEDDVTLSPNGLMFVKPTVRKSLLAKMLRDILDTRFMVKSTMKYLDSNLKQLYQNRQLALKLTANVTYGYTSASFSGRMPCSDIADAIVQTGRETLERAIEQIENEESWGAKVVYGDTDSLFVYLPGRSREEAFKIGREMADAVTKANPDPVTLKLEKVYHPSLLMAKKRYVGYSYETKNSPATFDAKGIETVRRDGYPAQQHIVEQCLRKLFETQNITEIKGYVTEQFSKIMNNDLSIQDFCFARAVKQVGTYKNPPPGAIVSEKKMKKDARAEPQYKERVPYVIIEEHGSLLRERARPPEDFLQGGLKLDSEYYIVKTLIPPLERIFSLIGVDVRAWYNEMTKKSRTSALYGERCFSCGANSNGSLCPDCRQDELETVLNSIGELKSKQETMNGLAMICRNCSGASSMRCESHDCPVYFKKMRTASKLRDSEKENSEILKELEW